MPLAPLIRPSLQAMIKAFPFYISIDTIDLRNGKLNFSAINHRSSSPGKITINDLNININGVYNDSLIYKKDQSVIATVSGSLFNKGKFIETYTFPLNSSKELFYCSGTVSSMPLFLFNPMIKYNKRLLINKGTLDSVCFSFIARENASTGTMKFMYHDLKIDLLNEHHKKKGLIVLFKSLLVNSFLIKESNPGNDGIVRESKIFLKHNPYRYFLNYSLQSILSGIEPAIIGNDKPNWFEK
jgi:hypothetical protein